MLECGRRFAGDDFATTTWNVRRYCRAPRLGMKGILRLTLFVLGEPGETVPDPYFGGAGPPRTGCVRCGSCMVGCRQRAKNTQVKNYPVVRRAARRTDRAGAHRGGHLPARRARRQ